jgi:hypothetical protein
MKPDIVHIALENLQKTAGIKAKWRTKGPLDGMLELHVNDRRCTLVVDLKNEVRTHQVYPLERLHAVHGNLLVLAKRIFPGAREELRQKGIAYLEANGNVFIKQGSIFLFIDANKPIDTPATRGNRAFTKTGLKVVFHLLRHRDHINLTHRDLAVRAGVGLGNIPQVLEGLRATGYLIPLNKREYVWDKRRELLERWVTDFGAVLRPKLIKERYTFRGDWKEIPINPELSAWGGEPAADLLTRHLRPEKLVLYTLENRADLMKNYRLVPKPGGEIEVLVMFWNQEATEPTAPAILVYADLLLEGGKRNKETADMILNEHIQPKL